MALALLPLQIEGQWIAIDAGVVHEILAGRPWIPIAGAPPYIPGLIDWRERAIAVLDLGALLGISQAGRQRRRMFVAQIAQNTFAIPVDGIREVELLEEARARPAHLTSDRFSWSEVEVQGIPMPILDVARIAGVFAPGAQPAG